MPLTSTTPTQEEYLDSIIEGAQALKKHSKYVRTHVLREIDDDIWAAIEAAQEECTEEGGNCDG